MPLKIVRIIHRNKRSSYAYPKSFYILVQPLDGDYEVIKKYNISEKDVIRCNVSNLLDSNGNIIRKISGEFDFIPYLIGYGGYYPCQLYLPENLVLDYGVEEGMALDLTLNQIIRDNEIFKKSIQIYEKTVVNGSKQVIPLSTEDLVKVKSDLLILTVFDDSYYADLKSEINSAYDCGLYTATLVLIRKLFENLIIDMFRLHYGLERKELFYWEEKGRHQSLSHLILTLKNNIKDFRVFTGAFNKNDEFFKFLDDIKGECNAGAHSLDLIPDPGKIDSWKPLINKYTKLFVRIIEKIKETPK